MTYDKTFGAVRAGLNYNPDYAGVKHRTNSAIWVRDQYNKWTPNALDLGDAKGLRDHLTELIQKVEDGIKEQNRVKVPTGLGAVVKYTSNIFFTRVNDSRDGEQTWVQNTGVSSHTYTDEQIDRYLNEYGATIISEGTEV